MEWKIYPAWNLWKKPTKMASQQLWSGPWTASTSSVYFLWHVKMECGVTLGNDHEWGHHCCQDKIPCLCHDVERRKNLLTKNLSGLTLCPVLSWAVVLFSPRLLLVANATLIKKTVTWTPLLMKYCYNQQINRAIPLGTHDSQILQLLILLALAQCVSHQ